MEGKSTNNESYTLHSKEFIRGANSAALNGLDYRFEIEFVGQGRPMEVVIVSKAHYMKLKGEE